MLKDIIITVVSWITQLYILALLLRFILQKKRANWFNPVTQFVVSITEPVVKPFQRLIPGVGGYDLAILATALVIQGLTLWLFLWLRAGIFPLFVGLCIASVGQIGIHLVNLLFYSAILYAIASWFPSLQNGPVIEIVELVVYPLFGFIRRYVPTTGRFDWSPLIVVLGLMVIKTWVFFPIVELGTRLAINL